MKNKYGHQVYNKGDRTFKFELHLYIMTVNIHGKMKMLHQGIQTRSRYQTKETEAYKTYPPWLSRSATTHWNVDTLLRINTDFL